MEMTKIITSSLSFISSFDYLGIFLLLFFIVMSVVMFRLNKAENSKFFFEQVLIDSDGRASTSKIAYLVALIISSWAFVYLTLHSALTEWFFVAYMSIWVLQRSYTKWIDLKGMLDSKDKGNG